MSREGIQQAREVAALFRSFKKSSHAFHDGRPLHEVTAELLEAQAAPQPAQPAQPTEARACEVLSHGEWVLYPLSMAAEAKQRGWPVRYLLAAQPAPWVSLTEEEIRAAITGDGMQFTLTDLCVFKAVEAKLKEKNT